jgi:hypothetical protein
MHRQAMTVGPTSAGAVVDASGAITRVGRVSVGCVLQLSEAAAPAIARATPPRALAEIVETRLTTAMSLAIPAIRRSPVGDGDGRDANYSDHAEDRISHPQRQHEFQDHEQQAKQKEMTSG